MEPQGAGELRDRVRFERRADQDDGYGNKKGDFATLIDKRSARLTPTRGGDKVIGDRLQGEAAFDLWVRFDSSTAQVAPGDRVVDLADETRTFRIAFAQDMTGNRRWILMQLVFGEADG